VTVHIVQSIPDKFEKRKKRTASFVGTPSERIRKKAAVLRIANRADPGTIDDGWSMSGPGSVQACEEDHVEN
jgi:hypothetical protein